MAAVHTCEFMKQFVEAGLVPDNCRRIVIDLEVNDAVKVYYECFGDDKFVPRFVDHVIAGIKENTVDRPVPVDTKIQEAKANGR